MIFVGIDPGNKGGIAIIANNGVYVFPMPTITSKGKESLDGQRIREILSAWQEGSLVFLEKVGAMPGQGVTSMFNFGQGFGMLKGILVGLEIPYELITPQAWKKAMLAGTVKDKGAAIIKAKQLFPSVDLRPTVRCKKDSDGMAEALLLAEYARRQSLGKFS